MPARDAPLMKALDVEVGHIDGRAGRLAYYDGGSKVNQSDPLLLIHSINAAASSFEVKPIFDAMLGRRAVYAVDLPGYGLSDRSRREYNVRLFVDAVHDMVGEICNATGAKAVSALAVSLSSEFLARAATETPERFRSLVFVTPTGFSSRFSRDVGPAGSTREVRGIHAFVTFPLWRRGIFDLLTSRRSIRYFLRKTFGREEVDTGLIDYCYRSARLAGAEYAPYAFLSGRLFSADIRDVYERLVHPIWMPHATRGDFKDFSGATSFEGRPNWLITPFETGALPHFEVPAPFNQQLEAFLDRAADTVSPARPYSAGRLPSP